MVQQLTESEEKGQSCNLAVRPVFVLLAAVAGFASGFTLFRGSKPAPTAGKALPTASTADAPVSFADGGCVN
jgi:hypothetical protein